MSSAQGDHRLNSILISEIGGFFPSAHRLVMADLRRLAPLDFSYFRESASRVVVDTSVAELRRLA